MTSSASTPHGAVQIRDRRDLPFFQVRLNAVKVIREMTAGPRRLRAIGFYALLCQLANEQRHVGEHRTVRVTYETLAGRARMSKRSVKLMLDALQRAHVIRYERLNDPDRGAVVSLFHLLVHDGAWTAITVAMADHLALRRSEGHLLRDLGLVVVLLEFCAAQRTEHGGLSAEVMRSDIAEQSGLTIDRVDDCKRVLQQAGLLEITRRRATNGGRHLPSIYTIHEAPGGKFQGGESELAEGQNGTGRAEEEDQQGGVPAPPGPVNGTGREAFRYQQGGDPATAGTASPPSNARAGLRAEKGIESHSSRCAGELGGREEETISAEQLCEALVTAWKPALGAAPRGDYAANRARWLDAAATVLNRHTRPRLEQALDYMVTDEILGSQALNMQGFAKVADQLIARAYARQQRLAIRSTPHPITGERLGWEDAKQSLQRAIQRHGREGRNAAVRELGEHNALLARFVDQVRWGALCEQPFQYAERRYAELWRELVDQANEHREEPTS